MPQLDNRALVSVDIVAWQRELGKTAFHIGTADRDYTIGDVFRALDVSEQETRQTVADYIDLPDVERLEAPPERDGATQVYVLGSVDLGIPDGDVLATDFGEENRRYTFIGEKTSDTMDVAPIETL